eukprot:1159988-Pelagomonas_calceolata.AAC.4
MTQVTDLGSRWSGCGWRSVLPVPTAPSSTPQWILGIARGKIRWLVGIRRVANSTPCLILVMRVDLN